MEKERIKQDKYLEIEAILKDLGERYPALVACEESIRRSFETLADCFENGGKLLLCGNGGSESDAQHIVGELMKSFEKPRKIEAGLAERLKTMFPQDNLQDRLQAALPAITLGMNPTIVSAYANDVDPKMVFAQEVCGYGKKGDVLLALTTSGNSENVLLAAKAAKAMEIKIIGICGQKGGKLKELCDHAILVPETRTYLVQEYTLPIYHALCRMLEIWFW